MPDQFAFRLKSCRHLLIGAAVLFLFAAAGSTMAQVAPQEQQGPPRPKLGISRHELALLRPALIPDLSKAVALLDNDDHVTAADLNEAIKECEFKHIRLGALGTAILASWDPFRAPNASMVSVYGLRDGSYHRLVKDIGFGPEILKGSRPVPDLAFGWTNAGCDIKSLRYRYQGGRYKADACNQGIAIKDDNCTIKACGNGLPTFPDPWPQE